MSFGAEHVEATEGPHLIAFSFTDRSKGRQGALVRGVELFAAGREAPALGLARGQAFEVAPEHDVHASTGHVGGDGDGVHSSGLGHDLSLAEVLLGVEYLVRDTGLGEFAREQLGLLDRRGAEQDRLAEIAALAYVVHDRGELRLFGFVNKVGLVEANKRLIRRDRHDRELVGVAELGGLRFSRTGHARELFVHAEVVLQGHRRPSVVLLLDAHAFLGLDRLVQSVGPPSTVEGSPGELIDDLHLAGVHQVVLIAVVELFGA